MDYMWNSNHAKKEGFITIIVLAAAKRLAEYKINTSQDLKNSAMLMPPMNSCN